MWIILQGGTCVGALSFFFASCAATSSAVYQREQRCKLLRRHENGRLVGRVGECVKVIVKTSTHISRDFDFLLCSMKLLRMVVGAAYIHAYEPSNTQKISERTRFLCLLRMYVCWSRHDQQHQSLITSLVVLQAAASTFSPCTREIQLHFLVEPSKRNKFVDHDFSENPS